jgi:Ca2+-transporting ATPase
VLEVPFLAHAFGFTPIGLTEYGIAIALAVLVLPIVEIVKLIQRKIRKDFL